MIALRSVPPIALAFVALAVTGCSMRSHQASGPGLDLPTPAAAQSSSPHRTIVAFSAAIAAGHDRKARLFFTHHLRAETATTSASAMMGISNSPGRYHYAIGSRSGNAATATLTFHFVRGEVTKKLRLVKTNGLWLIDAISPG